MEKLSPELLKILDDLTLDDFIKFKWFLKQDNMLEGQTGIAAAELENTGRCNTVDLMVGKYKMSGAKRLTMNILGEIGRLDLVERLKNFNPEPRDVNIHVLSYEMEGIGEKMAELEKLREFAVDVTLDPDTAHRDLVLSGDGKQVYDTDVTKDLPDSSKRFDKCASVLGKESLSGKFYFEVGVEGKTAWTVGVAKESVNRKGDIIVTPDKGFWTIWLRNKVYEAINSPSVRLNLKSRLQKVGVFVDHSKGLVSFYNVDTADL
ncbi:zinc-binding protein A33, partial [Austrofundulus limnaeus]|uniref:Zinc-binding protein A33 n=1 Tax=Austrofundulus limnaeus TaxID=52670 RepID=A0A2I4ALM6_AUSLI